MGEIHCQGQTVVLDETGAETLELFAGSDAYNRLLWRRLNSLAPVTGRVLEIGCGIGNVSVHILCEPGVTALHGIDLDPAYTERLLGGSGDPRLSATAASFTDFLPDRFPEAADAGFDAVVSSNVFEHLEDDESAVRNAARLLRRGGVLLLLVPAHPWLFSPLDESLSHFRRYQRSDFRRLAAASGLELVALRHFNPLGVLGWWLNGKLLRRAKLPAGQLSAYSRFAVPVSGWLDRWNPLPLGISLTGAFRKV